MNENKVKKYEFTNDKVKTRFLITTISLLIPIVGLYFHLNSRDEIIDDFNNNKVLTCNLSNILIAISKEDKYYIEDYNFVKGKTKIAVSKCEVKDWNYDT